MKNGDGTRRLLPEFGAISGTAPHVDRAFVAERLSGRGLTRFSEGVCEVEEC